jgi:hypothetical protein
MLRYVEKRDICTLQMRFQLPFSWKGQSFYLAIGHDQLLCKFVNLAINKCSPGAMCRVPDSIVATLEVEGQIITLRDYDAGKCNAANVFHKDHRYVFQGDRSEGDNFVFTVK